MARLERNVHNAICCQCRRIKPPGALVKRGGLFMCAAWRECRGARSLSASAPQVSERERSDAERAPEGAAALIEVTAPDRTRERLAPPDVFAAAVAFELGAIVNECSHMLETYEPVHVTTQRAAAGYSWSDPDLHNAWYYPSAFRGVSKGSDQHVAERVRRLGEDRFELKCKTCKTSHILEHRKANNGWGWYLITTSRALGRFDAKAVE